MAQQLPLRTDPAEGAPARKPLRLRYENSTGLLHTRIEGATDADGVARYIAAFLELMDRSYVEQGHVWHLVDARFLSGDPMDALIPLTRGNSGNIGIADRTAMVMASQTGCIEIAELPLIRDWAAFCDLDEARTWLMREDWTEF